MAKVILITGPSGAGKSTTSNLIAENSEGEWALISQDDVREFIKAGYLHADTEWTDDTQRQWDVSILIATDMIKRYGNAEINCVVDLFTPPSEFEKWRQRLEGINYELVVLLPDEETTVERNAKRKTVMKEYKVRENHEWFTHWKSDKANIIDTSDLTSEETVTKILSLD